MRKIECVIQSHKLYELQQALRTEGIGGMTVTEVKGFGNEQARPQNFMFLPKTKVEIYAREAEVAPVVSTIERICKSGTVGDGKIVVLPMMEVVRIRTGQRGEEAI